ncbi:MULTISPECIES: daunorubicin resistance protein DrrA family ABC transporter ATP-binding protein [Nocardiopsis]|uniref:Daunorubicin resistance ABC transporter ATPase subunit n=2 Tax=Nocardiopsis TaxID=2013 RepID=D7AV43_NOCDD|nr:daunorubicin resistance protein DrrA family ABC transporter ATP-binding protein [Nocardiopsis dassonvillei]ADH69593.1 daunorubicin resistance ABC transporter ATPase subunit [Nocardiopsis dassonvillei subsp. dassonvillei DSM 43111]APC37593.1 ABC transporter [Nocardiopsis dassonvillei]NKY81678.1 daunorubicin resistance protein DrrA family ABC transporter ATP-binding protein [Nocardiopsis dassonvillei]VEI90105.1 Daunorubicin/doxorubicin resistance ATP-binding protein DrrA [Nocardiopsis dassonvi
MIHTRGLTRDFRVGKEVVQAVRGVDIDVAEGELVALLGPNGAGKSTTLRMLTTLLEPTSGTAVVAGHDVRTAPAEVRRRIGFVGQGHGAGEDQRAREELYTQGLLYGLDRRTARRRADGLLDQLELGGAADREVTKLSGGQRRRLDIAMGLIHEPGLLFLDEPSTGLDPHSRANLWEHITRLRDRTGTTVVLTTHYLDEADDMAERVLVIDHGRVIADGTADELKGKVSGDLVTLTVPDAEQARTAAGIAERAPSAGTAEVLADAGRDAEVRLRVERGDTVLPELLRGLDAAGVPLLSVRVQRPTLDDVFLTLTGRSLREEGA